MLVLRSREPCWCFVSGSAKKCKKKLKWAGIVPIYGDGDKTLSLLKMTQLLKSYDVIARVPLTTEARNAGATGRKYWWAFIDRVNASSKKAACEKARKLGNVPASASKLKAYPC
jgi:hypothetical protein